MELFRDQLRSCEMSVTASRIAVLKAVSERPHSTADMILEAVKSDIGSVSKQAVYNVLSILTEHDLLRKIQPSGSPSLYENRVGDNHHHLICRGCGLTHDINCSVGHRPCLNAEKDHGFVIDEAEVIYWGMCPDCFTKKS